MVYKKILAPLDESKLAELSLKHVKQIASATSGSEVILLTVLDPVSHLTYDYSGLPENEVAKLEKSSSTRANKYISKAADRLKKEGINAIGRVTRGLPADKILECIEEDGIDLVIMSTHGRSGIPRWAMGSVADKVVRCSTVPVLIISPQGFRDSGPGLKGKRKTVKRIGRH